MVQVQDLDTLLWLLDSMVNFTLLKVKMHGTGQFIEFKELHGKHGLQMLKTVTSMLFICHSQRKIDKSSMKLKHKNFSSKLKVSHTDTTTSFTVGLILQKTTGQRFFLKTLLVLLLLSLRNSTKILLMFSSLKP